MEYFLITKTDKKNKLEEKLHLNGGYKFRQKLSITLYNLNMTEYILTKKIDNSFKSILKTLLLLEEDSDDSRRDELLAKIETLKNIILEKYSKYIGYKKAVNYIKKLEKIEMRIDSKKNKKSMRR